MCCVCKTIERLWGEHRLEAKLDKVLCTVQEVLGTVRRIEQQERASARREYRIMALGQDIADAVEAQTTIVDGVMAYVTELVNNQTIPVDIGEKIKAGLAANKVKLESLLVANTPSA